MPTSMMVVATSTRTSPAAKRSIARCFSSGESWPCSSATPWPREAAARARRAPRARSAGRPPRSARSADTPRRPGRPLAAPRSSWRSASLALGCWDTRASPAGTRPGGISSSTLAGRSPCSTSARLRGIGVAVITSRCGARPPRLLDQPQRAAPTPKRCCSSTITSRSRAKRTPSDSSACVPTTRSIRPSSQRLARGSPVRCALAAERQRRAQPHRLRPAARASGSAARRAPRSAP